MTAIDLNCDLGERERLWTDGTEERLLDLVSSANVACGGHAGDVASMTRTARAALERGVAVGAHPGYPDRARFGREPMALPRAAVEKAVTTQTRDLAAVVDGLGGRLRHLKPHGALYHAAAFDPEVARAIADAAFAMRGDVGPLVLFGLAGSPGVALWREMGLAVADEAFADRRYEADGSLRSRALKGALLDDPAAAAAQVVALVRGEGVRTLDGARVRVAASTLCLHSDTPRSDAVAAAVRAALALARVEVHAP